MGSSGINGQVRVSGQTFGWEEPLLVELGRVQAALVSGGISSRCRARMAAFAG
jgi:hypothetical protein